ncbi:Crp/Fnr family transcriptional regulator [Porphyromonas macacae]|uniref:Global nitrogen regulator n=1 Tax=Porphyromonas macacae TaxID=28115 RepID=A0A379DKT3_9PORP|nr:Crp/Fnr family transcriptional regulator [Porphyromonas macacae]SUB78643.1 Global nitrogen regulator [Porphyromonas macacae]
MVKTSAEKRILLTARNLPKAKAPAERLKAIWPLLLDADERRLLIDSVESIECRRGTRLFQEGDTITSLLYLNRGKVKMFRRGIGGRLYITRMIKPGQFFGIRPYFAHQSAQTTAEVFENAEILKVPVDVIDRLLEKNTAVARYFLTALATELGLAEDRTISLTQKHVRGRLAETLLFLMQNYGLENDGATLDIYLSREDLAALSNMTTSNAIRTLSLFASERIIALDGRIIKIIDPDGLEKISKHG